MPQRTTGLASVIPLRPAQPDRRNGLRAVGFTTIPGDGARVTPLRARPKDTIPKNVRRMVTERDMGLCVHCGTPAVHIHHRRLKGMGGTSAEHAHCPCDLVSVCLEHHDRAHRDRFFGLAEGLIVPASTPLPGLLPVMIHGPQDGNGARAYPTCDGRWIKYQPDGDGAA
jgi:hypothetical protein